MKAAEDYRGPAEAGRVHRETGRWKITRGEGGTPVIPGTTAGVTLHTLDWSMCALDQRRPKYNGEELAEKNSSRQAGKQDSN